MRLARATTLLFATALLLALAPAAAQAVTIDVDTNVDDYNAADTNCSIREAIQSANVDLLASQFETDCETGSGLDRVALDSTGYNRAIGIDGSPDITDGDLDITDPDGTELVADMPGAVIDANLLDRVIEIPSTSGPVTLSNLTIQEGLSVAVLGGINGGGISSGASLTLNNVQVTDNDTAAGGHGGGIQIDGGGRILTLTSSSVVFNEAAGLARGGGIDLGNGGSLMTTGNTSISNNIAGDIGGGVALGLGVGFITLNSGTIVQGNTGKGQGGGIAVAGSGDNDLGVLGAQILDNDVDENGGGNASGGGIHYASSAMSGSELHISDDAVISGNDATGDEATGGGINAVLNDNTTVGISQTIEDALIQNNNVSVEPDADPVSFEGGGGVSLSGVGRMNISRTEFENNIVNVQDLDDVAVGGGINNAGALTLETSTLANGSVSGGEIISGNGGPRGAGVYAGTPTGETVFINSTFHGNTVGGVGGSLGGAVAAFTGVHQLTVIHSTFAGNTAQFGAAMNVSGAIDLQMTGSLIQEGGNGCFNGTFIGPLVNGYNAEDGTSCVGTNVDTDLRNTAVALGSLQPNGGPTRTRALPVGSLVDNHVPAGTCTGVLPNSIDQRGAPRPSGLGCEPGAYEVIECFGQAAYTGSGGADEIDAGLIVPNVIHGLGGGDLIVGDGDPNRICGGDGQDDISGSDGADMISGDAGADSVDAGNGDDAVFVRDGVADNPVDCGANNDTVQTDLQGVDTILNCETIDFVPAPVVTPPGSTTTPPAGTPATKKCRKGFKLKKVKGKKKCVRKKKR